jgi:hypothetical protein
VRARSAATKGLGHEAPRRPRLLTAILGVVPEQLAVDTADVAATATLVR